MCVCWEEGTLSSRDHTSSTAACSPKARPSATSRPTQSEMRPHAGRETPLSTLQLDNMQRLSAAGAVILPASPGWYHGVVDLDSIVDFVVARILDQIEVDHTLVRRWGQ